MLDTILGLPAHPLLVHLPVVLLPLAALAVAVTVLTVLTGHSGATAAWSGAAQPTVGSTPSGQHTEQAATGGTGYTMADVEAHATADDCWAAVDGNAYDLTPWVAQHPGGPHRIENLCGTDATSAFTAQHSSNEKAQERLSGFLLGPLE